MALHVGLRQPVPLAGLLVLSGYLVLPDKAASEWTETARGTPVYFSHGTRDGVVFHRRGRDAYERLEAAGYNVLWSDYPMMHEVCMEQIRDIGEWLQSFVGDHPKERANS